MLVLSQIGNNFLIEKGEPMIRKDLLQFRFCNGSFHVLDPGLCPKRNLRLVVGKGTYKQGDFVTGDWTTLQAGGKKVSYFYFFQNTSNRVQATLSSGMT